MEEHGHGDHGPGEGHGHGRRVDENERRKVIDPDIILPRIGLNSGMTFLDVGCGEGFFAIPAARIVGQKGRVYGIDIDRGALEVLAQRASDAGLNVVTLKGRAEETIACEGCGDVAFLGTCLHDFEDPVKALENIWTMLRPGGIVADLDFERVETSYGPPMSKRFSEEKATKLIEGAGFDIASSEDVSSPFYLLIARKGHSSTH